MADKPKEICDFCKKGDDVGSLKKFPEHKIIAHFDCMLFSPEVITRASQDSQESETRFDISSVKKGKKRGKKLTCPKCKRKGATVGCAEIECWRTYHFPCVEKSKGVVIRNEENEKYIIYCFEHARNIQDVQRQTEEDQPDPSVDLPGDDTILLEQGMTYEAEDTAPLSGDQEKMNCWIAEPYDGNKKWQCENGSHTLKIKRIKTSISATNRIVDENSRDEDQSGMQHDMYGSSLESRGNEKSSRGKRHNGMQQKMYGSSAESSRTEESSKYKAHDEMQHRMSVSHSQNRRNENFTDKQHDGMQHEVSGSSAESRRNEESSRNEERDGMQNEMSGSPSESRRNEESSRNEEPDGMQHEMSGSPSESRRNEESSKNEEPDGMQHEMSGSPSESSRNKESSRSEEHARMQHGIYASCSRSSRKRESSRNEHAGQENNLDEMQCESYEPSSKVIRTKENAMIEDSDVDENTCQGYMTEILKMLQTLKKGQQIIMHKLQQQDDINETFVRTLVGYLRKIPEDKKLSTEISILTVLSSVLTQ